MPEAHFDRIGDAKLAPPTFKLFSCQDEHKVPWKSVNILADSSLELSCLHSIKLGQVAIKYDFIAADKNKCGWLGKRQLKKWCSWNVTQFFLDKCNLFMSWSFLYAGKKNDPAGYSREAQKTKTEKEKNICIQPKS